MCGVNKRYRGNSFLFCRRTNVHLQAGTSFVSWWGMLAGGRVDGSALVHVTSRVMNGKATCRLGYDIWCITHVFDIRSGTEEKLKNAWESSVLREQLVLVLRMFLFIFFYWILEVSVITIRILGKFFEDNENN